MRCFSTILFALMAMVLPMAGVQRYFCTMNMSFVASADACPVKEKDCCGKTEKHKPGGSDCMAVAKSLPNGETPSQFQVPDADGVWSMVPVSPGAMLPCLADGQIHPDRDRGPPDRHRLYIEHQRLLI